jgi:hypothetical protein
MTGTLRFSLRQSLALADESLRAATPAAAALAFGLAAEDPLRLNLPPLAGGGGLLPGPQFLRVAGSLYLHAELEQAGVVAVAELLAAERRALDLTSVRAAELLEDFARRARQWYDRDGRVRLFARLFGTGAAAARPGEGRDVNREFQQLLANLCGAVTGYSEQYRFRQRPTAAQEALVRQVANDLLVNLGARQYGNATAAATQIQDQLRRAIELLSHEGIAARFQARGMWDVLRKILGRETPDLGRLITRGQSGQRLFEWLASALPQITETPPTAPLLPAGSPVFALAASWLEASGFSVDSRGAATKRVA